jgi:DegV family protein with EDD domain
MFRKKEREQLLEKQRELESALLSQSRFFANMSHEIRTPINTIIGLNEMTLREPELPEEIAENSIHIQSASKMLLAVINDILDMSKIESGQMEIVEGRYELAGLFGDVVNMNWVRAHEKGLEFQVYVSDQLPSVLRGDETRIKQVVNNLLSNAIKYTPEGTVSLSVDGQKTGPDRIRLHISVADTGIGMKQEDLPNLFQVFKRVDEGSTKGIEGTGLGLSIVKQLVERMGGSVAVDSIYHKGSTFTVLLEQEILEEAPIGKLDYSAQTKNRIQYEKRFEAPEAKVLVVDDNEMNLLVAKKLLRDSQVQLELASSGRECLNKTTQVQYDLIFMDHVMPGMDGVETLAKVKNQIGGLNKETPIVALTANAASGMEEKYRSMGFSDYLAKPISGVLLEDMLLRYLSKNKVEYLTDEVLQDMSGLSVQDAQYRRRLVITTDSVSDLPEAYYKQLDVPLLRYYVNTNLGHFEEVKEIHSESVIEYMLRGGKGASEPPTVAEYENFFGEALRKAEQVIHIAMASGAGEGYARACQAAKGFAHVAVVDSGHLSSGMGLMVMEAAKLAMQEVPGEEILQKLDAMRSRISTSFILDSPDFLYGAGRLSKSVYHMVKQFSLHPKLAMRKRKIAFAGLNFSEMRKASAAYVRGELKGRKDIDTDFLFLTYAGVSKENREKIIQDVEKYQHFKSICEVPASAAISSNCGPGTFGLIYKLKEK